MLINRKKKEIDELYDKRSQYHVLFERNENLLVQIRMILKHVKKAILNKEGSLSEDSIVTALNDVMYIYFDWMSILSGLAYYHLKYKFGSEKTMEIVKEGISKVLGYDSQISLKDATKFISPEMKNVLNNEDVKSNIIDSMSSRSKINDPNQRKAIEDLQKLKLHFDVEYKTREGKVVELFIWQNWIKELPESIAFLTSLETLILGMNHLTTLPNSFTGFTSLKEIYLDGNNFTIFPPQLLELPSLETINLNGNNLTSIPESIHLIKNLRSFNLSHNHSLKKLPRSIVQLNYLETLDLTQCYDITVPEELSNKEGLSILGLDDLEVTETGNINIQLLIRDYGTPAVVYYEDEELRKKMINPQDIVIKDTQIKIKFTYPLSKEAILPYTSKGGFTRLDLFRCIYEGYKRIYDEEDLAVGDPGTYERVMNRKKSEGPYGIWGHYLGELWIEGISYNTSTKMVEMFIGS
jgi:hypothetical protein